jgi:molecular chaperone DnaK
MSQENRISRSKRPTNNDEALVFGIDLGTTNSCIARVSSTGTAEVLVNQDQMLTTPSVVAFPSKDEVVVGLPAKRLTPVIPEAVCSHVKRKMGMPPNVSGAQIALAGRVFAPEEISALILRKIVNDALIALGRPTGQPVRAVITVPAYFGSIPKNATQNAAQLAEIELLDLIHEPVAAAISYGFSRANAPMNLLVYDLGGGTFDATVVQVDGKSVRTLATDGERLLSGYDWDEKIVEWLRDRFDERFPGTEMNLEDPQLKARLFVIAEQAKIALSDLSATTVNLHHDAKSLSAELTRDAFEKITEDKLETTIEKTRAVLAAVWEKGVSEIHRLVLVGGSSKMPAIPRRLKEIEKLREVAVALHEPDLAVAKGAALLADMIVRGKHEADLTGRMVRSNKGRLVTMVNAKAIGTVVQLAKPVGDLPVPVQATE